MFLTHSGVNAAELSLVFVTGSRIRAVNRARLGHDYVTDVITFNLGEGVVPGRIDGEIYICPAEARRNARIYGEPEERELLRYLAHGILHLLGQDDATLKQRAAMRAREEAWLALVM